MQQLAVRRPRASVTARAHGNSRQTQSAGFVACLTATTALPAVAETVAASDAMLSVGAIAGVAGLGGLLLATDPQKRRDQMTGGAGGDEMKSVKDYFETAGSPRQSSASLRLLFDPQCTISRAHALRNNHSVCQDRQTLYSVGQ
jgi:hypothetical protein